MKASGKTASEKEGEEEKEEIKREILFRCYFSFILLLLGSPHGIGWIVLPRKKKLWHDGSNTKTDGIEKGRRRKIVVTVSFNFSLYIIVVFPVKGYECQCCELEALLKLKHVSVKCTVTYE